MILGVVFGITFGATRPLNVIRGTACVLRGRTIGPGAGGGGGTPGGASIVTNIARGKTCGESTGTNTAPPSKSTSPATPMHVLQNRFDEGPDESAAVSNMTRPPFRRADTLPPKLFCEWIPPQRRVRPGVDIVSSTSTRIDTVCGKKFPAVARRGAKMKECSCPIT
jgi:hypothetical protein